MSVSSVLSDIESREDINLLVTSFYAKVRQDDFIGPIFNRSIPDGLWPWHMNKITDFWETVVFGVAKFKGNPKERHQSVDRMENETITQAHFGRWLQLWYAEVNELFEGSKANAIKDRARIMSTALFLGIAESRKVERCPLRFGNTN